MEIFEEWLYKAERVLEGAIKLFEIGHSLPDLAVYHTQQAAEKAFKAFLAFKLQPIEKTHDLNVLVNLCKNFNSNFVNISSKAAYLNGFDIKYRYPGDELEPNESETIAAINFARKY